MGALTKKPNPKRTPGRGKGPRGPTINPEEFKRREFQKLQEAAKNQTKRPAVGK